MIRHASPISLFGLVLLAMGANVTYAATAGGIPMPEATHGGAIHLIPAEAWGLTVVVQGAALMFSVWRQSPGWLFGSGLLGIIIYGYLAIFAGAAEFGFIVCRGAAVFTALQAAVCVNAVKSYALTEMERVLNDRR